MNFKEPATNEQVNIHVKGRNRAYQHWQGKQTFNNNTIIH